MPSPDRATRRNARDRARSLRKTMSSAEVTLWQALRRQPFLPFHFRRQAPVGQFIADFLSHPAKLIIELDGPSHAHRATYDSQRTARLNHVGFTVLRFQNHQVHDSLDAVLTTILQQCKANHHP